MTAPEHGLHRSLYSHVGLADVRYLSGTKRSPVPDIPIIGFSPQHETDLTGTGVSFAQAPPKAIQRLPLRPQQAIARPSLPPFSVAMSIVYVLGLLGTGLYFLLSN
jgi:hypothetical protein